MCRGSTSHGGSSLNEPMARSAGRGHRGGVYGCAVLSNYRVIELGMWVAGPAAGGLLADWGADVVKVETPVGDPMRRLFQLLAGHGQPESPPFDLDNRGKRSVVIDLSRPDGVEVLRRLLADADVFLTNLRPEAVERLGLGPDALARASSPASSTPA